MPARRARNWSPPAVAPASGEAPPPRASQARLEGHPVDPRTRGAPDTLVLFEPGLVELLGAVVLLADVAAAHEGLSAHERGQRDVTLDAPHGARTSGATTHRSHPERGVATETRDPRPRAGHSGDLQGVALAAHLARGANATEARRHDTRHP